MSTKNNFRCNSSHCPKEISLPLSLIFQKCIDTGKFPDCWKLANVQPVYKKNDRQLKSNYRPISLLPLCGKIFEKIIFDQVYAFLDKNKLISTKQSGFRPGDSCIYQLISITSDIQKFWKIWRNTCCLLRHFQGFWQGLAWRSIAQAQKQWYRRKFATLFWKLSLQQASTSNSQWHWIPLEKHIGWRSSGISTRAFFIPHIYQWPDWKL